MRIALAGNPNCGKTTLYNAITGKTENVGNWSGVTVDKKEAELRKRFNSSGDQVIIVDLPGAYSITPFTSEETVTRDFILTEKPDVIINIVDGANVSRSLFFTTQLLELGIPMVIALNKSDILKKRGDVIDQELLAETLGCAVFATTATSEKGLKLLLHEAIRLGHQEKVQTVKEVQTISDKERQMRVDRIADSCIDKMSDGSQVTLSDRVDRIVAHKWLGIPIFFLVMWAVFAVSIHGIGGYLSDYCNDVLFGQIVPDAANSFLKGLGVSPILQGLIVDGIIAGVGAVIGFIPLVMVMFFCLSLLEDCGYMARVAVVMDRFFKKIGLSGKSIIPMIVGSGCAIPGVMATRTIEDVNEKRMTVMLTPFIPCTAKLPIIALFTAVFFPHNVWIGPAVYVLAIVMIIIGGLMLKKVFVWESSSMFIMELPEYKVPSLRYATKQMMDKAWAFIVKASTIILVSNTIIWFAQAYSWGLKPVTDQSTSILASIGGVIAPILLPLGFMGWQMAASAITGFIAKENVVATLAVILAVTSDQALAQPGGALTQFFNPVTGFAFLAFNLFTPPCFAAIGAMNAEMGERKWLLKALGFQFTTGYLVAMVISQVGSLIVYHKPASGFVPSLIVAVAAVVFIFMKVRNSDAKRLELEVEA